MAEIVVARIDLSALTEALDKDAILARTRKIAQLAHAQWILLAKRHLQSTASDYIRGIQPVEETEGGARIELQGELPNMVERGWPATDLRRTLLTGRNTKTSKAGHTYRYIAFRRTLSGGKQTQHAAAESQAALKRQFGALKRIAQALEPTRQVAGRRQWGGRGPEGVVPKARARHLTDLYASLYRFEHSYQKRSQSNYGTFRTISTNPKSHRGGTAGGMNWVHPGIPARWLSREVEQWLRLVAVPQVFGSEIGGPE